MSETSQSIKVGTSSMRDLILDHATRAFATQQFNGVKISKLCKAAGIANGTFYIYFRDKDALYRAVMQKAVETFLTAMREAEEQECETSAEADLRDLEIIVDFAAAHPWLTLALFNDRGLRGENNTSINGLMVEQRASIFAEGQSKGQFRADIDPELAARAEVAVTAELVATWIGGDQMLSREKLIEQLHGFRMRLSYPVEHWNEE